MSEPVVRILCGHIVRNGHTGGFLKVVIESLHVTVAHIGCASCVCCLKLRGSASSAFFVVRCAFSRIPRCYEPHKQQP